MNRYIRIEENSLNKKEIVTYYIDKCNNCPLMVYNKSSFICKCRVYKDSNYSNIVKGFVINFFDNKLNDSIDIPNWCGLPKDLTELKNSEKFYILKNDVVISSYKTGLSCFPLINNTFSGTKISVEGEEEDDDDEELLDIILKNSIDPMGENDRIINTGTSYIKTDGVKCSLCGEIKDDVKRREHDGMCDECYNKSESDDTLTKKAFINNFRLKRNIVLTDKEYKIIK